MTQASQESGMAGDAGVLHVESLRASRTESATLNMISPKKLTARSDNYSHMWYNHVSIATTPTQR
jgi:hypothetical protein